MVKPKKPVPQYLVEDFKKDNSYQDISSRINELVEEGVDLASIEINCDVQKDYRECDYAESCSEACFISNIYIRYQKVKK